MTLRWMAALAAVFGGLGVVMGAVGSHAVSDLQSKEWIRLASNYQLIHSLAILASLGILRRFHLSQLLFIFGVLIFSGGLYGLAFTGSEFFRTVTPIGGISWIVAWFWSAKLFLGLGPHSELPGPSSTES